MKRDPYVVTPRPAQRQQGLHAHRMRATRTGQAVSCTRIYDPRMPPDTDRPEREIAAPVARRFLAIRHFLAPARSLPPDPVSVMAVVDRFGSLQFDPIDVIGRNHDLVLLARIGGYRREWTEALLYRERLLYETYNKGLSLVPTAELPYYRISWDVNRDEYETTVLKEHATLVQELLERIRTDGPMSATDVEPRAAIDWWWRPTNQVRAILEALSVAGILGLARRDGNRRVYDLVERLFPADVLAERRTIEEQRIHKLLSRYRAHGLLGVSGQAELWYGTGPKAVDRPAQRARLVEDGLMTPVAVEGIKGVRFVMTDELSMLHQAEREVASGAPPNGEQPGVAFLAPLDPLVWDRQLLRPLFGFDYIWEVYVPAPKRRWGYYVLPLWFGDRFVGRIEPRIDRQADTLRVIGLWFEDGFDPFGEEGFVEGLAAALEAHRRFGGVKSVELSRSLRPRPLVSPLRAALRGLKPAGDRLTRDRPARSPVVAETEEGAA
jgi:uncharacterized protein YcaQ